MATPLRVTREQILAFRRSAGGLDARCPWDTEAVRRAAWAGLQDSSPRSAVLSLAARLDGVHPGSWADPGLVQVWGPRYNAYAVAAEDAAVFTLGRWPTDSKGQDRAHRIADRLAEHLGDRELPYREAGAALGVHPNALRYAAPTGRVLIRWQGSGAPSVRMMPPPRIGPDEARAELARRFLRVLGPGTPGSFARWGGLTARAARRTFGSLARELIPVRTPLGDAWTRAADEPDLRGAVGDPAVARLLPSGDAYALLWGADRDLLVPDAARRERVWPSRVWPGIVLVRGEVAGTWRRSGVAVRISAWQPLSATERRAVEAEGESLPLAGLSAPVRVVRDDASSPPGT